MSYKSQYTTGFTLLEILLVVVILAVLTAASVQLMGVGSYEDRVKQQSQNLIKQLNYMCEKAVFENRPFALEFSQDNHQLLTYRKQKWQAIPNEKWPFNAFDLNLNRELFVSGKPQSMSSEMALKPHIICYNSGQLTAFELLIKTSQGGASDATYQIISTQPTQIKAGWLNES